MSYFNPYPPYNPPMQDQINQLRQPYQPYQQMNQPQQSGMVWVRSRQDAENYPVAPYTAIALWDESGPYVYRKETDVSGRASVKTFKLVEVTAGAQEGNASTNGFVTRKEFDEFARRVSSALKEKKADDESVS